MNDFLFSFVAGQNWHAFSLHWILTLAHFLWQGAAIGLLSAMILSLCRHASARIRHGICLTAMTSCLPCIVATWMLVDVNQYVMTSATPATADDSMPVTPNARTASLETVDMRPGLPGPVRTDSTLVINENQATESSLTENSSVAVSTPLPVAASLIDRTAPALAIGYFLGVLLLLFRTSLGLWGGRRLRALSQQITDTEFLALIEQQARRIGLKTVPVVAYCSRVTVPTVIGLLKPIVLLPASLVTSLAPDQLAAILSHEFAHIRRLDLFVNLLQRLMESLLFFHPVVWWLSRRISVERENCCDDLAAESGFGTLQYAGALLRMAELSLPQRSASFASEVIALSVDGSNASHLSRRIERLLDIPSTPRLAVSRVSALFALMLCVISVGVLAQIADKERVEQQSIAEVSNEKVHPDEASVNKADDPPESEESPASQPSEKPTIEKAELDEPEKPTAPAKGLEFLKPYPKLYEFSLDMTEVQFLTIVEREKLKIQTDPDGPSYMVPTNDGHIVILMFGNNGNKCSGIQRIRGELPDAKTPPAIVDDNGVSWSDRVSDGFRVGAKILTDEGKLSSGERLVVQYVLMNESDEAKTLPLVPSKPVFPNLGALNRIELSLFPANVESETFTLKPGEILEESAHRVSIDTTGFPPGQYRVLAKNFFWRPDPNDPSRKHGIPIRLELPLTILLPEGSKPTGAATANRPQDIDWGRNVAGLQVGSRVLGDTDLFAPGSAPQVQLFLSNITEKPVNIEILLPHPLDGWLLNVENQKGENILLERTSISAFSPQESFKLRLSPGETIPVTGAEQSVNEAPRKISHSTFRIERKKPEGDFWKGGILVSQGGVYGAIHTVFLKRPSMPGVRLSVDSGKSVFRVNGPELKRTVSPDSLHGFDLSPYRSSKSFEELQKIEPMFDRDVSLAEGGSWRCLLDSDRNYYQWQVYYSPSRAMFYVVDIKPEPKVVYGPISGDAITKLRLLDGSSDLVASNPDDQNKRRAADLHERRVESLVESTDTSLRPHGLKAFLQLDSREMWELKKWNERVAVIANSDAGRGELKPLADLATEYLQQQRDRIEAKKVKIDDDDYRPGRKPAPAELALPWGPANDGLSLAIADWTEKLRFAELNDHIHVDYLVRNTSDSPRRISTLNVLDGVGVTVIDEQTRFSARLDFVSPLGIPLTERYLLQPGEVVTIKQFSFEIRAGDLHPAGKAFNPKNLKTMYGYVNMRPGRTYRLDFTLSLPSAYTEITKEQITMPAKGEFDGKLVAKPLRLALRNEEIKSSAREEEKDRTETAKTVIRQWKARLVNGMTGKPLPGIRVRAEGSVAGKPESQPLDLVSDESGIITVPLRDGITAFPVVQTAGWWGGAAVGHSPAILNIVQPAATGDQPVPGDPNPEEPRDIKLWPGQKITGRLLYPDKSPAAGVLLNVGVYIHSQEWKKRLGMDLGVYSWDHGQWPNWTRAIITNDDGRFTTTVPPANARSWVRVGTTGLGFGSIKQEQFDAEGTGRALATCVPFEADLGGNDPGFGYTAAENSPAAGSEDKSANFGTLQMQAGTLSDTDPLEKFWRERPQRMTGYRNYAKSAV